MNCGIYKITSPSGKIYIGQSRNLKGRYKLYKSEHCVKQAKLYASFKKYGFEKHSFVILEFCSLELLNEKEKYYISLYDTFNSKHGMNLTSGGDSKRTISEETKVKISKGNKGRKRPDLSAMNKERCTGVPLSKDRANKLGLLMLGKKHSAETKEKMSKARMGYKHSEEAKNKISATKQERGTSEENKLKISERMKSNSIRCKKVINIKTGQIYDSAKLASQTTSLRYDYFKAQLNGNRANHTDFKYLLLCA